MDGVVNVRKPAGPTSHDVVDAIRRIARQKRVGHTGTLDPMATGVLVVCLGKATRLVEYLVGAEKTYRAEMILGARTDTQDSTGEILGSKDASGVGREELERAVSGFIGEIEQVPPMVSAVRQHGKRLYELAREGKTVDRKARAVTVHSIDVVEFRSGTAATAVLDVRCGSGTYIRTLCADIGDVLGCGAHMSMLERTRVGRFGLDESVSLEELEDASSCGRVGENLMSMNDALADMDAVIVPDESVKDVCHGMAIAGEEADVSGSAVRMVSGRGDLLAVGKVSVRDGVVHVKPEKVLAQADC